MQLATRPDEAVPAGPGLSWYVTRTEPWQERIARENLARRALVSNCRNQKCTEACVIGRSGLKLCSRATFLSGPVIPSLPSRPCMLPEG